MAKHNFDAKHPIFAFLPIEIIIKKRQKAYYTALKKSDKRGNSTIFIEFMLKVINEALIDLLNSQNIILTNKNRIDLFRSEVKNKAFSRQEYLKNYKNISPATASRDLKNAVAKRILLKIGDKRTTKYKFRP